MIKQVEDIGSVFSWYSDPAPSAPRFKALSTAWLINTSLLMMLFQALLFSLRLTRCGTVQASVLAARIRFNHELVSSGTCASCNPRSMKVFSRSWLILVKIRGIQLLGLMNVLPAFWLTCVFWYCLRQTSLYKHESKSYHIHCCWIRRCVLLIFRITILWVVDFLARIALLVYLATS